MSASAYDAVPYASHAFPQSQPEQLAVMATLFGLEPALPSGARVLELGCSSGGNLIPLAARHPGARFLGIDYSKVQADEGAARVRALGLDNVEIRHQSIDAFGRDGGPWDYIVCHGVYSWVPPPMQEVILRLCRDNLAPHGVAYVSYNTYPGWKMREIVRDTMMFHVRGLTDTREKIAQARAIVKFMQETSDPGTAFGKMLAEEAAIVGRAQDFYLFHEHLEANNRPCYFREFVERAAAQGLGYLGEASLADMAPQRLGPKVFDALQGIAGRDVVATEQYMDFLRNRSFRQTLLVHAERLPAVRRGLTPESPRRFLLSFGLAPVSAAGAVAPAAPDPAAALEFRDAGGRQLRVAAPLLKSFLLHVGGCYPRPVPHAEALAAARAAVLAEGGSVTDADVAALEGAVIRFVLEGFLRLHLEPLNAGSAADAMPLAFGPARQAALRREDVVPTLRHETVRLNPVELRVLELLDGTRSRAQLQDLLVGAAVRGEFTVRQEDRPVVDPAVLGAAVTRLLADSLARFARAALLVAPQPATAPNC
jgi:SAM-dependent methyltransferase